MTPKVSKEYKEEKYQHIIEAAIAVFIEKGYKLTTIKDIADYAKISRGTVYLYFSSTEEIFEAILDKFEVQGNDNIDSWFEHCKTAAQALELFFKVQEDAIKGATGSFTSTLYEYFLTGWQDVEHQRRINLRYGKGFNMLLLLLKKGVETGEFTPILPLEHIVHLLLSTFNGMTFNTLSSGFEQVNIEGQMEVLKISIENLLQIKRN